MANKKNKKATTAPKYTWAMCVVTGWKTDDAHPVIFDGHGNWIPATHNANNATGCVTGFATSVTDTTTTTYLKGAWKNTPVIQTTKMKTVPKKHWAELDAYWNN